MIEIPMNIPAGYLLTVGGIAGTIAAVCAVYFAWQNITSQGLVLGVAAFVGAFVLVAIQLFLELKAESTEDLVTAEYTFDALLPEIASAFYADAHPGSLRAILEKDTSADVATTNRDAFKASPESLAQDMAFTSLIGMFFSYQQDWQLRPLVSNARYTFGYSGAEKLSQPSECSSILAVSVNAQLKDAGNTFASVNLERWGNKDICLPPGTRFLVKGRTLEIETPQCTIEFAVNAPRGNIYGRPELIIPGQTRHMEKVMLENGDPRYINMNIPIKITVRYTALYATHRDMAKIRTWVSSTLKASHEWFEGTGSKFHRFRSSLDHH